VSEESVLVGNFLQCKLTHSHRESIFILMDIYVMQYLLSIVNKYLVEDIFVEKLWDNFKGQYV